MEQRSDSWLTSFGLTRSKVDPCCYILNFDDQKLIVVVWVDDIFYFGVPEAIALNFRHEMCQKYKIDDQGVMKWFLGIAVEQTGEETVSTT